MFCNDCLRYPAYPVMLHAWLIFGCSIVAVRAEEPTAVLVRGLNLNGPALEIDGHVWDGKQSQLYVCEDKAFESQDVELVPATDTNRAQMIRSSRWGGNRIELKEIPDGNYSLFLYVWEDNNPETYSIVVNGRQVVAAYGSGSRGHWEKLGPWYTSPKAGKIVIESRGGAANFSGIELWQGKFDGVITTISDEQLAFFEKRIRPLLADKCYECHSQSSQDLEGDLLVDSRASLRRGGSTGPAVVPGDAERSLILKAIRGQEPMSRMPPDESLSNEEIADLERWVLSGAADPRSTPSQHLGKQIDIAAARQFWSLRPLANPPVPVLSDSQWPRNDVDRFILAGLRQQGLEPSMDADRRTWIRRATYDLTGLPPTTAEVSDFLTDGAEDAFARVIERLLNSPRYGERWGRHWLDIVRYADTAGDNSDYPIPQIYRYRDWVIDAFNRDLAYDEFIRDQLAGDIRGGSTPEQQLNRLIATGYIANSRRFGSRVDDYPQHLTIEDTIDNLGRSFLGMSLSCARCHDHKFDPITTRDYYGLYGIFHSTRYPWPGIELDKRQRDFVPLVPADKLQELEQRVAEHQSQQSQLDDQVLKLKKQLKSAAADDQPAIQEKLDQAQRLAQEHRVLAPEFETAYAVSEQHTHEDVAVQLKGDPARLGDIVSRHFPEVLGGGALPPGSDVSGRQQLAEWIVDANNPLTARVMVNRIWQYHFGRGIVPTPNDFGRQGKPASHPELLDYLAIQFRDGGWSVKAMHRMIMLSSVYRQSSFRDQPAIEADPANQWLAGFPRQRLDAEQIRDSLLFIGGNLDLSAVGPHPFPNSKDWDFTQHKPFKAVYETAHRSVYLMTQRIQRHPFLAIFDGADPSTSTASRLNSTTPLQALYLLNDPFVHEQSRLIADRIRGQAASTEQRLQLAYELVLGRPSTAGEISAASAFLHDAQRLLLADGAAAEEVETEAWQACVRSMLRLNEFVYLD